MLVRALRKIVNSKKGIFTFWLVIVFMGALCIKNIAPIISAKGQVSYSGYKYDLTAVSDDDSATGFFDSFDKDFDSDDSEFLLFENLSSKLNFTFQEKHQYTITDVPQQAYNDALYDLYCNWKFHLS